MNAIKTLLFALTLTLSQGVLAAALPVAQEHITGEWTLLATQLSEDGEMYEDDGSSRIIFTSDGKLIEKSGFGALEREYYIEDGKLLVKTPFGSGEWQVTSRSGNKLTIKTVTGILYLEKQ